MAANGVKETLRITFPRVPPYNTEGDYIKSKNTLHGVQLPGQVWDQAGGDIMLNLTASKRKLLKTSDDLKRRREFSKEQKVILKEQWEELEELESELQSNFDKMDTFIKSNEEKRARASARQVEDAKWIKQREQDIARLTKKMEYLQAGRADIDREIASYRLFHNYLDSVVGATTDYKNADDIIDRYEALVTTKNDLGKRQSDNFTQLEHAKSKMAKFSEVNKFRLLGMANLVASLNSRYQIALALSMKRERLVHKIKHNAVHRYKEIMEVTQSCWNTYTLMCRRKDETPKIPPENFEKQLLYIKKTLSELAKVKAQAAAFNKTFSSTKVEASKS